MRIAFRTQGGHVEGLGDVRGALALADELNGQGGEALFLVSGDPVATDLVSERGYRAEVHNRASQTLAAFRPDAIVVIKLNTPAAELDDLVRVAGKPKPVLVTIDDSGRGARNADLRFNPLYAADPVCEQSPGRTFSGPRYVTLRREFQTFHNRRKTINEFPHKLLILQGGADTHGFLPSIVRGLAGAPMTCRLVTGEAFRHNRELADAVNEAGLDIEILKTSTRIAEQMWEADLAITAGGLSMYELACVGTPSIVVAAERFENESASQLAMDGAVVNLGFGGDLDFSELIDAIGTLKSTESRTLMSARGKALVDGLGSHRIIEILKQSL